ncbi:amidohydrolase family protein [Microbacterium hydrocarbonoxydans]|uniref:amidohydrolase family protein n=1 Tax=Microbacterium hydrocarbonoxydans TaxID=273678 RepID=UPI0013D9F8DA|nr:amidohydrolase family protein [Microbacterium hydrocarbonoxydans]
MSTEISPADVPLLDHHCHGVTTQNLGRGLFEALITESDWDAPDGTTHFDTQVGFAIRRHCAPVLGLEPFATAEEYLTRRRELGGAEASRRLLRASGISDYFIEIGHRADEILDPAGMADAGAARAFEIVRLERLAEELVIDGCDAAGFRDAYARLLDERLRTAIGVKSIAAYRIGLDFAPERPSAAEVDEAVVRWIAAAGDTVRLDDPVIIRHLLWAAVDRECAIQFHIGYGDADVDLHRCSPLLLTEFLRLTRPTGARVLLLHCYPFHREAGYLAHVFPHVYFDVGLAINYTGSRSDEVIAETFELAPFHKILFSSDAFGAAELYYLGALLFRRGLQRALDVFAERDGWPAGERSRVTELVAWRNARRAYRLDDAHFASRTGFIGADGTVIEGDGPANDGTVIEGGERS